MGMVNYFGFGEIIQSDFAFDDRLPLTNKKASITITKGSFSLPEMEVSNVYRAGEQAKVGSQHNNIFLTWGEFGDFKIEANGNITYQHIQDKTATMFLLSEVMGISCWLRGKYVLHAGAIAINGKAHIFAGTPGKGKSTTIAALWQMGAVVLSDDLVLIKTGKNSVNCIPSIAEIKIWEETVKGLNIDGATLQQSSEGRKKYFLPTAKTEKSYPITSINIIADEPLENFAALELLKYFPLPNQILAPTQLKRHFQQSVQLQQHCIINHLSPKTSFQSLKSWAKEFIEINAS
jgi:hypothetical protein